MTDFNPLSGAILGSTQAQRQVEIQRTRQLRRAQSIRKNVAARDDELEHQVESPEELPATDDQARRQSDRQDREPSKRKGEDGPHIDVKA